MSKWQSEVASAMCPVKSESCESAPGPFRDWKVPNVKAYIMFLKNYDLSFHRIYKCKSFYFYVSCKIEANLKINSSIIKCPIELELCFHKTQFLHNQWCYPCPYSLEIFFHHSRVICLYTKIFLGNLPFVYFIYFWSIPTHAQLYYTKLT